MPISIKNLRSASYRQRSHRIAKSLTDAISKNQKTAFLCHSHKDHDLAIGLQNLLSEHGWDIYIDWQDQEMPEVPNRETAEKIKAKVKLSDWFLFLATPNSTSSRWCPWEIGYADAEKAYDRILIIPTEDDYGRWHGNEYLQLYRSITDASNKNTNKQGYAVFEPGTTNGGTWVENL